MRYMQRGRTEPLPWLKHKLYLASLWTGAYMLDNWEVIMLVVICAILTVWGYVTFIYQEELPVE